MLREPGPSHVGTLGALLMVQYTENYSRLFAV